MTTVIAIHKWTLKSVEIETQNSDSIECLDLQTLSDHSIKFTDPKYFQFLRCLQMDS